MDNLVNALRQACLDGCNIDSSLYRLALVAVIEEEGLSLLKVIAAFCVEALDRALAISQPEIFNTDQGGQYTSEAFTDRLKTAGVRISMDGRGRVYDNIFVERLWRTVKYEEVYLHHYETMDEAWASLARYFQFYNRERPHQALAWRTPHEAYFGTQEATGGLDTAVAVATPVGLRPPSVATAPHTASTLNHARSGLDNGE